MKYLVFAGGGGTRFWPLSRSKYPKQFLKIFNGKSTFQLTVDRLRLISSMDDVIVCTSEQYLEIIKEQVPDLSPENIYLEPSRKNIAPALALCLSRLRKDGYHGNVAINWADHIIADIDKFGRTMKFADMLIGSDQLTKNTHKKRSIKAVVMGAFPKFANNNFGWITFGEEYKVAEGLKDTIKEGDVEVSEFSEFVYKPEPDLCNKIYESGKGLWHTGYAVFNVDFLYNILIAKNPELAEGIQKMDEIVSRDGSIGEIATVYNEMPAKDYDHAVLYHIGKDVSICLKVTFEWDDPGTLYAFKKFLSPDSENLVVGEGRFFESEDSMIYNNSQEKIVVVGLKNVVIVKDRDVTYVVHRDAVVKTSDVLNELKSDPEFQDLM